MTRDLGHCGVELGAGFGTGVGLGAGAGLAQAYIPKRNTIARTKALTTIATFLFTISHPPYRKIPVIINVEQL